MFARYFNSVIGGNMLIFTNRIVDTAKTNEDAFTTAYTPFVDTLNAADSEPDGGQWKLTSFATSLSDDAALKRLKSIMIGTKPVLVYLHGNNNTPATCFKRCQQIEEQYGVAVIGFSWTSEGYQPSGKDLAGIDTARPSTDKDEDSLAKVKKNKLTEGWIARKARRYAQAKVNAQHSRDALARFLRLVAAARLATMTQKVSFAAHSLGCHFLHYAIDEQDAEASLAAMHNVVLMAGCTGASKHAAWVGQINPLLRTYITYTKADSVLAAARVIDGDIKLGAAPGDDRLASPKYRYIDFEGAAEMSIGAHRYFVANDADTLSKQAALLFKNLFSSLPDVADGGKTKSVYPVGCSNDGSVCFMGAGSTVGGN
jgi:esterase/lipase superfamily enzyme